MTTNGHQGGLPFPAAGLPLAEERADRYRRLVQANAAARAAAALRQLIPAEVLDGHELEVLAAAAVDGAWPAFCEQADLFSTQGRLVARQWGVIDELRWELERRNLDDLTAKALARTGGSP